MKTNYIIILMFIFLLSMQNSAQYNEGNGIYEPDDILYYMYNFIGDIGTFIIQIFGSILNLGITLVTYFIVFIASFVIIISIIVVLCELILIVLCFSQNKGIKAWGNFLKYQVILFEYIVNYTVKFIMLMIEFLKAIFEVLKKLIPTPS